jgi:hypothetical protein
MQAARFPEVQPFAGVQYSTVTIVLRLSMLFQDLRGSVTKCHQNEK